MMGLSFAAPWVLGALLALPALYYLLRIVPPSPKRILFPPMRLFLTAARDEVTAFRTPWWLLALRLALLTAVILAVSGPVWRGGSALPQGPLLLVLDDSWPAAPDWDRRVQLARGEIEAAQNDGRPVALALLSRGAQDISFQSPDAVLRQLAAARPGPVLFAHGPLLAPIRASALPGMEIEWFSDGLSFGGAREFGKALQELGRLRVWLSDKPVLALAGFSPMSAGAQVHVRRSADQGSQPGELRAFDARDRLILTQGFTFASGLDLDVPLQLPVDLLNQIDHVAIKGLDSAGARFLLDASNRRVHVGLVGDVAADVAEQPLLNALYYLKKALSPHAEIVLPREGAADPIANVLEASPTELILADVGRFTPEQVGKLNDFLARGGVLVRFTGPRVTGDNDPFLPVTLRHGERAFGAALSWDKPKTLAAFEPSSPFAGLKVPEDVTVSKQVLAEPDADLPRRVWASLADGTPLVTAAARGKGLIVLFHINADTSWSNLALSGLFVNMLHRISERARLGGALARKPAEGVLAPRLTLDGFGALGVPSPLAKPLPAGFADMASLEHPPGLYGAPEQDFALNAMAHLADFAALDESGFVTRSLSVGEQTAVDLRLPLLVLALLLFLVDCAVMFRLQARQAFAVLLVLAFVMPLAGRAKAEEGALAPRDIEATLNVHLAYILTGDSAADEESRAGLEGLSRVLARRTSVAPGAPVGVDPAKDVLDLYPLIYWPIVASAPQPPAQAMQRLAAYMNRGGTLLVDTRDALMQRADGTPTPEQLWLRRALQGLDIPPLEPVPPDHVMTKTFYLLDGFYGRTTMGETYVEALPPVEAGATRPVRAGDSVSPIIITSNDLAAAWAMDDNGQPLFPLLPGSPRQRELALRGGVNIVMYTLTGSYKADQVHVKALLERMRDR